MREIRVWDLPVRLFHWLLVLLMVFSYITGDIGDYWLEWHMRSGIIILILLVFRVLWGFFGSRTARFSDFLRAPRAALDYLRALRSGESKFYAGHNPAGGWMITVLLALGLIQGLTGLFSRHKTVHGPLMELVSAATAKLITKVHSFNVNLLLLCVAIHVAAALYYVFVKRENLIRAMFNGRKPLPQALDIAEPAQRSSVLAGILFLGSGAIVYGFAYLLPRFFR
jgi:cytochrome b